MFWFDTVQLKHKVQNPEDTFLMVTSSAVHPLTFTLNIVCRRRLRDFPVIVAFIYNLYSPFRSRTSLPLSSSKKTFSMNFQFRDI